MCFNMLVNIFIGITIVSLASQEAVNKLKGWIENMHIPQIHSSMGQQFLIVAM